MTEEADRAGESITVLESVLPLATMLVCLFAGSQFYPVGSALLIVVMLIAATVAGLIAWRHGHGWIEIQQDAGKKFASVLPAILILLSIGILIGSWMFSGTIPALVYYGIRWINPEYMVLTAFLVTSMMSLTGSSWVAAGTIGVALIGVASAIGAPLAPTAGAVVSGAYFGDKLSPLSDLTNICAIAAKADLYDHIYNMLYTAVPSFVAAFLVYFTLGALGDGQPQSAATGNDQLLSDIAGIYQLSGWVFLPALVVIIGMFRRFPAALTMIASSVVALVVGIVLHGFATHDPLTSVISGFDANMINSSKAGAALANESLTTFLNRGGVYSMSNTLILIVAAFLLAAGMDVSGGLNKLLSVMLKRAQSVFGLVVATMGSGATMIALTSHGGVTALIVGGLFQKPYSDKGLAPENLSRSLEDSVTIVEPLMPWTVSALYMATTLGVPTVEYMPWAVFCMTGPVFSLLLAATFSRTGFGLKRKTAVSVAGPGSMT
jgi:NhaC family Na+:H+ antiporter